MGQSDSASFEKPADAYDRFVGRYGPQLARATIEWIGVNPDWRVLDVGCGPGPLTSALAETTGAENVSAVDPSESFASACAARLPGADVRVAPAEELPFEDSLFDLTCSQLVVNFLSDAPAGVREMRRVTRPQGVLAASVWDYAGEMTMLRAFWDAACEIDPDGAGPLDEGRRMPYCQPDELARLWSDAGLTDVATDAITVGASHEDFHDLWAPITTGVGPAGSYCASLPEGKRDALREIYFDRLGSPSGSFELTARAWVVRGKN